MVSVVEERNYNGSFSLLLTFKKINYAKNKRV